MTSQQERVFNTIEEALRLHREETLEYEDFDPPMAQAQVSAIDESLAYVGQLKKTGIWIPEEVERVFRQGLKELYQDLEGGQSYMRAHPEEVAAIRNAFDWLDEGKKTWKPVPDFEPQYCSCGCGAYIHNAPSGIMAMRDNGHSVGLFFEKEELRLCFQEKEKTE